MSGPDWCRWYPAKWLSGVLHLTNEQRGVYIQIINVILDRGECSSDPRYLGRLCNCRSHRATRIVRELIALGKLVETGAKLHQNRAESERKVAQNLSESGRLRASHRWNINDLAHAKPQCTPQMVKEKNRKKDSESVPNGRDSDSPHPPTDSSNPTEGTPLTGGKPKTASDRGSRMPEDWRPSDEAVQFCRENLPCCSDDLLNREFPLMKDWALTATGTNSRKRNWDRFFINWMRRACNEVQEREARERRWAERRGQTH